MVFGDIRTILGNFHLLQYLSRDLALYFQFLKGDDKPCKKFTIPTAAINSSSVFRWFGQHAFTIVFAIEINRSITYESQFQCRFIFCSVWIHVFLLFSAWHTVPILLFWTMLCVQCTPEEMIALAMYRPLDIFSSSLYMILNNLIEQRN